MKRLIAISIFCLIAFAAASAQDTPAAQAPASTDAGVNADKLLYTIGYLAGENVKQQLILERGEEDSKAISQGMRDALLDRNSQTDLEVYKPLIVKRFQEDAKKKITIRRTEEAKEMEKVKKEKGAKTRSKGIIMKTVKEGKGKSPKAASMVKVNYEGSLLDGTVFDSSYKRNMPAQFALNAVIPCWTEALQQMKVGEKAKLFCPPDTAYGDSQAGMIPPGSTLVFDVELLEVND